MSKKSKYGAIKTEFKGVKYDSKKEAIYAQKLDKRLNLFKNILHLKRQVKYAWIETHKLGDQEISFKRSYIADFTYLDLDKGENMVIDVKGYKTAEYKKKKKIVEHLFGIKITEV